jgi:hypothetical protein
MRLREHGDKADEDASCRHEPAGLSHVIRHLFSQLRGLRVIQAILMGVMRARATPLPFSPLSLRITLREQTVCTTCTKASGKRTRADGNVRQTAKLSLFACAQACQTRHRLYGEEPMTGC